MTRITDVASPRQGRLPRPSWHRLSGIVAITVSILVLPVWYMCAQNIIINRSESLPANFYRLDTETPPGISDITGLCLDDSQYALAADRGYVYTGYSVYCPQSALLLKRIVAAAGDVVVVTASAVTVNGRPLVNSAPFAADSRKRPMMPAYGEHKLTDHEVWLMTGNPKSWDSRYFGPQPVASLLGTVTERRLYE